MVTKAEILIQSLDDTDLSKREKGDIFERYVEEEFPDLMIKRCKASGSLHGEGDLSIPHLAVRIDCKLKGKNESISIPKVEINKIEMQAAK